MSGDDLRTRAREAAERYADTLYYDTTDAWRATVGHYMAGFLAAYEQLPGREDIARAIHAWDVEGGPCEGPWGLLTDEQQGVWLSAADALLALIRGGQL